MEQVRQVERLVARDIRQCEADAAALVEKMARTREVRDFPTSRALAKMQAELDQLTVKNATLRIVASYMAGAIGFIGPAVVEDFLTWVDGRSGVPVSVEITPRGQKSIDAQLAGYDAPAGAGEDVEAYRG